MPDRSPVSRPVPVPANRSRRRREFLSAAAMLIAWVGAPPAPAEVEPRAAEIARAVLQRMGGEEAWNATRYVRWKFFGGRQHYWDRHTGDVRIEIPARVNDAGGVERPELVIRMNVHTKQGRVRAAGEEVQDPRQLEEYLGLGHEVWVNDSYWMFMPYKLLDPGVTLKYSGTRAMQDGREADVLDLTFAPGVGYTPQNRYEVFVARDTGLVEQWSFFADAADAEAQFTMPWSGWKRFGDIWLATGHGRGEDWDIAVEPTLPRSLFTE
jgi:hypothetical protein